LTDFIASNGLLLAVSYLGQAWNALEKWLAQLGAGSVYINGPEWNSLVPLGGFRQSDNGWDCDAHGLNEYIEIKASVGYF